MDQKQILRNCLKFMKKAESMMECPICFNSSKEMVQCLTGHHVCRNCKKQMDECPLCKNAFLGTRSFLIEDLTETLHFMKLSLSDLDEVVEKPIVDAGAETVRKLLKSVLFNFSAYCQKNNGFLLLLKKYLQNPNGYQSDLEGQLTNLTEDLRNLTRIINDTEQTLTNLKK